MVKLWFSSDHHFGHENIIHYCNRPFANAKEMDEHIIDRHNSVVAPSDHYYCLGDVAMNKRFLSCVGRLNGHGRLIGGNHDIFSAQQYLAAGFEKIMAMRVHANIIFTHVPVHPASLGRFRANVHGHVHQNSYPFPYINVSMEVINYTPVSLDEIVARIDKEGSTNEQANL
jgi:calcineurin-like phosphoesterase family protein